MEKILKNNKGSNNLSTPVIKVDYPGLMTTVQDLGRYGFQSLGVPASGALDLFQSRLANILVGNFETDAVLEITILGPKLVFLESVVIALTGADLTANLDGEYIPRWEPIKVEKGSELSFGECRNGARAYLSVSGNGFDVPLVMGSRSTYLQGNFGGYDGRSLQKEDVLNSVSDIHKPETKMMPSGFVQPDYSEIKKIRIVPSAQNQKFTPSEFQNLTSSTYKISNDSDRIGYRLEGPSIQPIDSVDIISEGNPAGAIQVSGDGVITILLSDRGTTGGYSKIASVINSDLNLLAQLMPGDSISFVLVSVDEARNALMIQEKLIHAVLDGTDFNENQNKNRITIDGVSLEVVDESGEIFSYSSFNDEVKAKSQVSAEVNVGEQVFNLDAEIDNN